VQLDGGIERLLARQGGPHDGVRRRSNDLGRAEVPEFEANGRRGAVAQSPREVDPRSEQAQDACLRSPGELAVAQQQRGIRTELRVERLVLERDGQCRSDSTAACTIDREDRAGAVPPHEQVFDTGGGQRIRYGEQVGDTGLVRRQRIVEQRQLPLAKHHIRAVQATQACSRIDDPQDVFVRRDRHPRAPVRRLTRASC
jgi:hypothetical protein